MIIKNKGDKKTDMKIKQILAAVLAAGMIISIAGCSTPRTALTVDGEDVPAGLYVYTQHQAVTDAMAAFKEEYPDVDDSLATFDYSTYTLDGKLWKVWIADRTVELCAQRVAQEQMFNDMQLFMSDGDYQAVNDDVNSTWAVDNEYMLYYYGVSNWEEYYTPLGVSQDSYRKAVTADAMREKLFNAIYGVNGTEPVPEADLKAKFNEDYARIRVISMPLTSAEDGSTITDPAELDELKTMAQSYLDRLAAGEAFTAVYDDYYAYATGQIIESDGSESDGSADENSDGSTAAIDEAYEETMDSMVDLNGTAPSEGMLTAIKAATIGTPMLYQDTDAYYVFVRLDISVRTDWFETYRSTLLHSLKNADFDAKCAQKAAELSVVRNEQAIAIYDPDKLSIIL
jgi:hypothetical protein